MTALTVQSVETVPCPGTVQSVEPLRCVEPGRRAPDHLPAAGTVRCRPIPTAEPRPALRLVRDPDPIVPGQQELHLSGRAAASVTPRPDGQAGTTRPTPPPRPGLPEPRAWTAQFVQVALEVAAGFRPPGQVVRWTSTEVFELLGRRHRLARPTGARRPLRVRAVLADSPRAGVVESTAVVDDGRRARAVAVRLEVRGGRWRVTALETG